jgi:hypothetical protein
MSDAWRGVQPVFQALPVVQTQFQQCMACGALLLDSGLWQHEQWHRSLVPADLPPPPEFPKDLAELMAHIDALYIFLGEDPVYNVGVPSAQT